MVLVPSNTQPELTTVVVEPGLLASSIQISKATNHAVASGAKSPAKAIGVQLPSLDGHGEQPNTAWVEAQP